MVALRQTDDGGQTMGGTRHWRGAAEYAFMDVEEGKGRKERGDGQDVLESKAPGRILEGGGKEGTKIISDGKHRILRSGHRGSKAYSLWDGVVPNLSIG